MPEQAARRAAIVEYEHVSKSYATAKLRRARRAPSTTCR